MRKLFEISKVLKFQKRIVAAATVWGNTVTQCLAATDYFIASLTKHKKLKIESNENVFFIIKMSWNRSRLNLSKCSRCTHARVYLLHVKMKEENACMYFG